MLFKTKREKNNEFNKKLYHTNIIQGIFDRINVLENRIIRLEGENIKLEKYIDLQIESIKSEKEQEQEQKDPI